MIHKLVIHGRPMILKNRKTIAMNRKTGKAFIRSSKDIDNRKAAAILSLRSQWRGRETIDHSIGLRITAYIAAHHASWNIPDISNLYEAPQDFMTSAGIITDDRLVEHHDGSRRICLCDGDCPRKPQYSVGPKKGQQKSSCGDMRNCPYQRVEIEIVDAVPDMACKSSYCDL